MSNRSAVAATTTEPRHVPNAHIIRSDAEAIEIARKVSDRLKLRDSERDSERAVDIADINAYSDSGLWGITVPKEFGGAEVSYATLSQVIEILSEGDASLGQIPQNHYCLIEDIRLEGSAAQKAFFFDLVLKGNRFGNAFSEAGGKNVLDIQTTITRDGDHFVVNGRKAYATGALYAHWVPVLGVDPDGNALLAFVERDAPGLEVVDDWSSFGQRITASGTVIAHAIKVTADRIFPTHRSYDRPTIAGPLAQISTAAIDAGIASAAIRDTVDFVKTRARPWIDSGAEKAADDVLTVSQIGDLYYRLHAAEALLDRAGRLLDAAKPHSNEENIAAAAIAVAEAKVATTEIALLATNKLFELGGTRSTLKQLNLDRHWRNARVHTLHDPVRWKYHAIGNYHLNGIKPQRHSWL